MHTEKVYKLYILREMWIGYTHPYNIFLSNLFIKIIMIFGVINCLPIGRDVYIYNRLNSFKSFKSLETFHYQPPKSDGYYYW